MTFVSWGIFHEGPSDAAYFDVMLPRLMEHIVVSEGVVNSDIPDYPAVRLGASGREVDIVAREACDAKGSFKIVFFHADTGGRALEAGVENRSIAYCEKMGDFCAWPVNRCITIVPRHETEAWVLADPEAVTAALGYTGRFQDVGLPADAQAAERLPDPKACLANAMQAIAGKRRKPIGVERLFPAIAQRQSVVALRKSSSFREFETRLRKALSDLGCIGLQAQNVLISPSS
jgi:hypothetical protein